MTTGQRWQQLNDWLSEHRDLWQPAPFTEPCPEWVQQWPEMARYVEGLSDEQVQYLDDHPGALAQELGAFVPSLSDFEALVQVSPLPGRDQAENCTLPEVRARDMPGRKRLQAGAFTAAVQPLEQPLLDWCCGKGHLARTLLPHTEYGVTGLEWNPLLVGDGNRLAEKAGDSISLKCQDVMDEGLELPANSHGVALHACGDLHRRLFQQGAERRLRRLSVSPCCFHLTKSHGVYQPLSVQAQHCASLLSIRTDELRLAVEETVTAPQRVRHQVQRMSQWRLGFDALQRQVRDQDAYLPVPSHPTWVSSGDFEGFCRWAAAKKRLPLPASVDFDHWEGMGVKRLGQVRRHELVRHLFRRPLELWLVLDYQMFLEEQGYAVRLGTFCDRSLTPRNLLIDAQRGGVLPTS